MWKYLLAVMTLASFSGCSERVAYIKPKVFDIKFVKQCKPPKINPLPDGTLPPSEHKKLLSWAVCESKQRKYYYVVLKNIKKAQISASTTAN